MPSRPLTVLMTTDAVGGVWSYSTRLCAALPDTHFVLATLGPRPHPAQREEIHRLCNVTLIESGYRLEWMVDGGADLLQSRLWLSRLVGRFGVDVVHINGYAHACLDTDRPVIIVAHSDVYSWWEAVHKSAAPPVWEGYRAGVVAGLAAAIRIIAPTAATLRDLDCHYLLPPDNAAVISNGVDMAAFQPLTKRPVVLSAGRLWDAGKNLAALDAVASQLRWPVEIAGETQHPDGDAPNFANVRLLGRLDSAAMAQQLGRATIFAAPARYEPFGLAVLEAAASGCALVLGDIPSLRENWNGAALFVDPENPPELAGAINALIAEPQRRSQLAAAARRRAGCFTLARMAEAYAALYEDVAFARARLETA
jgi:glycogen(starch) synthase